MKQQDSWEEQAIKLKQLVQRTEHQSKIREAFQQEKRRYSLNMDEVREISGGLAEAILREP